MCICLRMRFCICFCDCSVEVLVHAQCSSTSSVHTGCVGGVSDHREEVLDEINEVGLEELSADLVQSKLLQQEEQDIQADLCHIAHRVLECPHNGVHEQLELGWRDLHQRCIDRHTHTCTCTRKSIQKHYECMCT